MADVNKKKTKKVEGIESRVTRRAKRQKIQDIVLTGMYAVTAVGLVMAAPNAVQLLKHVEKYVGPQKRLDRRIAQAMTRLKAKGLISSRRELTAQGKKYAESVDATMRIRPNIPLRWDKKWRIVIFDVWERRRPVRDRLRGLLESNGFVKIQNSVWVYPYPCEELFAFLRADLRLGLGMLYIVAEEIENDQRLRKHFGLPVD
ncbi:hypothetical protein A3F56_02680 [Candidatus Kaiserbacteria bacterium RIFCSPHIGHO2_12_FULL_55_13]|nr:MAG: hypothetical protein A3F56_02680 [Candidatus Kaiserbacteria bacterium RIFCSPHIGHO2_12_FULL_55_13]